MRVLCFGDSNTYGYDPRSYLGGRYDAGSRWMDLLAQRLGTWFVDTEHWKIDLTFDGVHFSEQGHRTFAQRLSLILREEAC